MTRHVITNCDDICEQKTKNSIAISIYRTWSNDVGKYIKE